MQGGVRLWSQKEDDILQASGMLPGRPRRARSSLPFRWVVSVVDIGRMSRPGNPGGPCEPNSSSSLDAFLRWQANSGSFYSLDVS